jgi:hypothetical protein
MTFGVMGGNGSVTGPLIKNSVRVTSGAYFNRTPSITGNRKTYTVSMWIKRGDSSSSSNFRLLTTQQTGGEAFRIVTGKLSWFSGSTPYLHSFTTDYLGDQTAWYHIVLAVDTTQSVTNNRIKCWINNHQQSTSVPAAVPQNYDTGVNAATLYTQFGTTAVAGESPECLMAYIHLIDGQALTPSSFAAISSDTGRWAPILYTGTYGTNGFHLDFRDATNATTLGYDYSGNINHFTFSGISLTPGLGYSVSKDVPVTSSSTLANYAEWDNTWAFVGKAGSTANNNMDLAASSVGRSDKGMINGKWYWEITSTGGQTNTSIMYDMVQVANNVAIPSGNTYGFSLDMTATDGYRYTSDGTTWVTVTPSASLTLTSMQRSYFISANTSASTTATLNCGQIPFTYTTPSEYKTLNTYNVPEFAKNTALYNACISYNGNGTSQTVDLGFAPDLIVVSTKAANGTYCFFDSTRGDTVILDGNLTAGNVTDSTTASLTANGFSVGSSTRTNPSGILCAAFAWKKGAANGFDIVQYSGTGVAQTINHSLGVQPTMIIIKRTDTTGNWPVWHRYQISSSYYSLLNTIGLVTLNNTYWNGTAPTSSVFSVGTNADVNASGGTYIAYIWAEVPGNVRSGSWSGGTRQLVHTGFVPGPMFTRNLSTSAPGNPWILTIPLLDAGLGDLTYYNTGIGMTFPIGNGFNIIDYTQTAPTGFGLVGTTQYYNAGGTYIYTAFAQASARASLAAAGVFGEYLT